MTESGQILYNPNDCSMPGSSVLHYSRSLLKFMPTESVMLSNHFILCPFFFQSFTILVKEKYNLGEKVSWNDFYRLNQFDSWRL